MASAGQRTGSTFMALRAIADLEQVLPGRVSGLEAPKLRSAVQELGTEVQLVQILVKQGQPLAPATPALQWRQTFKSACFLCCTLKRKKSFDAYFLKLLKCLLPAVLCQVLPEP